MLRLVKKQSMTTIGQNTRGRFVKTVNLDDVRIGKFKENVTRLIFYRDSRSRC